MFALQKRNDALRNDASMATARGAEAGAKAGPSKISTKSSTLDRLSRVEALLADLRQQVHLEEGEEEQDPPSTLDLEGEIT